MIRFLNDETVAGHRFGKGAIANFDHAIESTLIEQGDAANYPLPVPVHQSYAPITRSSTNGIITNDTDFQTMASIIVPGGTMNYNGKLVIEHDWKHTNSIRQKTLRIDWGGAWIAGPVVTTSLRSLFLLAIKNTNSLSSQTLLNSVSYGTVPLDTTAGVDTTQDARIELKCNWDANVASEEIILLGYSIWYYPGND